MFSPKPLQPFGSIWLSWVGNPFTYCWESQFRCSLWEVLHRPVTWKQTQANAPEQAWMACCQLQVWNKSKEFCAQQIPAESADKGSSPWMIYHSRPLRISPLNEASKRADSSPRWASANRTCLNSKMLRWDGIFVSWRFQSSITARTALQVAAVLVLPGILCPSGCKGARGWCAWWVAISAMYNGQVVAGMCKRKDEHASACKFWFFQTLYKCTCIYDYFVIIYIPIYIYKYHIYINKCKFWWANPVPHWGFHRLRIQWQWWTWIKRLRVLSLGMFGTRLPPNPMVFGNLLRIKSGISGIPVYQYRKFWINTFYNSFGTRFVQWGRRTDREMWV